MRICIKESQTWIGVAYVIAFAWNSDPIRMKRLPPHVNQLAYAEMSRRRRKP